MRRAPSLISNLIKSHHHIPPKTLTTTPIPSHLTIPIPIPFHPNPTPCPRPQTLNPNPIPSLSRLPCRPIQTLSHHPEQAPKSGEDDDHELGVSCLESGHHHLSSGNTEEALDFAVRALKTLERTDGAGSLSVVKALRLLGLVTRELGRFDDSLESLTTAEQILSRLVEESVPHSDILSTCASVQDELASTKTAMGKRRDALPNLRRAVELKAAMLEPGELGRAYRDLAEAYVSVLDFEEAARVCMKAVGIYEAESGEDSVDVAQVRRLLGVVYTGMGENEAALKQNELARRILQCAGPEDELIHAEIEAANIQLALGRLEEAVNTLKRAIQRTGKESETRALVLISMAKAMCGQDKFGDAKRCLEISCSILGKMESVSPAKVAEAYADTSMLYETMAEFETALSIMKRTVAILEKLPQEQHLEGSVSARIGWLLLLTGRVPQAVPYLESAVEKLKESFGPKHFGLGFAYKHLGQAYLNMDQPQSAVKMLALAKDIIYVSFGPDHEDSIDTCQCLANAYGAMGSYDLAMEFQHRVVDAWEGHGSSAVNEFREAHRLLEQLKRKAQGSPSAVFPANALPSPQQK